MCNVYANQIDKLLFSILFYLPCLVYRCCQDSFDTGKYVSPRFDYWCKSEVGLCTHKTINAVAIWCVLPILFGVIIPDFLTLTRYLSLKAVKRLHMRCYLTNREQIGNNTRELPVASSQKFILQRND